jgi:hypothetical protein
MCNNDTNRLWWELPPVITTRKKRSKLYCCQCRSSPDKLFQCSRCKVTQYCSKKCQRTHYSVHKQGCLLLQKVSSDPEEVRDLAKGDVVFQIAYRSCDTVERGAFMYEQALDHYFNHLLVVGARCKANPMLLDDGLLLPRYLSIYDRVRFLLVALGHFGEFAAAMCSGQTTMWDDLSQHAIAGSSQGLQVAIGLLKMQLIASLRADSENYALFTSSTKYAGLTSQHLPIQEYLVGPANFLVQQEEQLLTQINNQLDLWPAILDRTGQLSERTAPLLFSPNTGHPMELYCFLQDCFFFDAGVSKVLNDLPEFDEDDD